MPDFFSGFIRKLSLLLIIFIILTLPLACSDPTSQLKPAEFEVQDIYIYPEDVMPGDDVSITVTVINTGEVGGIYSLVLKMGQSDIDSEELTIAAGEISSTDFVVEAPDSGVYQFSVGNVTKSLRVYEWQKYKIVYDKCMGNLGEWGFGYTFYDPDAGCTSYFTAPSKYFKVNKLTIFGFWRPFDLPDPEEHEFTVKIWSDEAKRTSLWSRNFPYSIFRNEGSLRELELPDIRTDGSFYVEVIPRSESTSTPDPVSGKRPPKYALFVGLCVRTDNPNAGVTYRGSSVPWPENWPNQDECSFMIRVEGEGCP